MQQPDVRQVKKIVTIQFILGLVLAIAALPFGAPVAISVLIGAGTCVLANAMLAGWVFREYRAQKPERLVARFYGGEVAKIVLIVGVFAVAFATLDDLNIAALLAAYFVVQVVATIIAAQLDSRTTK
ncbi:F0F1 ATP synthase assembly protein I [Thiorhodococcus mannitoliphagus]|uniref:F0F1 ATP synthase assembly protein I n=1 Tax=Thiorhodococcus mannitoliphagus TaxID=329406 RepID=A0A6P1DUA9_9GAMM|nr:ATP synthase subunit I [Thiorhodococcus mannitoliphagus]NEX21359.1 F0F1 ATP synthase assembly protein I [Thiorhodococcus mannitoliphagus]